MIIANDVPSRRASIAAARTVVITMPAGEDEEAIRLMFDILGWQAIRPAADGAGVAGPPPAARLHLTGDGAVVHVSTPDHGLAAVLARNGLDRLPLPVALPALEQLMVVAG